MKITYIIKILLLLILLQETGYSQSRTIESWTKNREGLRKLCFYPTTLRMVNLSKDESFYRMVRDIEKLKIIIPDNKKPVTRDEVLYLRKGIKAEDYKDMIQVKRGKELFYVFVKEQNSKPVGFAGIVYSEDRFILVDLEGYLSPEVISQLIDGKLETGALSKIYDITKPAKANQKPPKKE